MDLGEFLRWTACAPSKPPVAGRSCISQDGIAVLCHEAFLVTGADSVNVLLLLHHCRECRPGKRLHQADHW